MPVAVVAFTRDLRITDHPALAHACAHAEHVVPLFVFDDAILRGDFNRPNRTGYLLESLVALDDALQGVGARLVVRRGDWVDTVLRVAARRRRLGGPPQRRRERVRAPPHRRPPSPCRRRRHRGARARGRDGAAGGRGRPRRPRPLPGVHPVPPALVGGAPAPHRADARTGPAPRPARPRQPAGARRPRRGRPQPRRAARGNRRGARPPGGVDGRAPP